MSRISAGLLVALAMLLSSSACRDTTALAPLPDITYARLADAIVPVETSAEWNVIQDSVRLVVTFRNPSSSPITVSFNGGNAPARLLIYDGQVANGRLVYNGMTEFPYFPDVPFTATVTPGGSAQLVQSFRSTMAASIAARADSPVGVVVFQMPRGGLAGAVAAHLP